MKPLICMALALLSLGTAAMVSADDREAVESAAVLWADTLGKADPDAMVALYDPEAVLLGTTSPTLRQGPAAIREYFADVPEVKELKMTFEQPMHIRIYGDTAINTGYYTVSYTENGEPKAVPLRYSFVYRKKDGIWKIVDHHSSTIPAPNRTN
jgi:uncharacterized protein (TIGR02246 family)